MPRHVIAGIDPGSTAGIALLDLSGKTLLLQSIPGGIGDIVRIIERSGTPSLIACDVSPPPETAQRIASFFSCRIYSPAREIREMEKTEISRGLGVKNNHERDAYCSALLAFRSNANKLRQIESLGDLPPEDREMAKHLVLKGFRMQDVLLQLRKTKGEQDGSAEAHGKGREPGGAHYGQGESAQRPKKEPTIDEYRQRIGQLSRENANLRMLAEKLENEKRGLEGRVRLLENGVRQSFLRDSELRKLRFQLKNAAERLSQKSGGMKWRRERKRQKRMAALQNKENWPESGARAEKAPHARERDDGLNSLGEPKLDLEKLVMEYRKGREKT